MRLRLPVALQVSGIALPAGDYTVELDEGNEQVWLRNHGLVAQIPVMMRASKVRVAQPTAQVRRVRDEPRWLLIVRTPPATELVASLDEVEV